MKETNREKLYQKNIYALLDVLESQIKWEEKVFQDIVATSPNSYASGYHSAIINTLNNLYCAVKDLQTKTFHNKEFNKEDIEELINET